MGTGRIDVWKYPHMTYKKAFVCASVVSVFAVGAVFTGFSDYIRSHMTGHLQVTLISNQEATQVAEAVKQQIIEEQKQHEVAQTEPSDTSGGAGAGGQGGSSSVPVRSSVTPTNEKATAGEAGTVRQSSVGTDRGDGLQGAPGPGIGFSPTGNGEGISDQPGTGGDDVGNGGGYFNADGYQQNLQSYAQNRYPPQALRMGVTGTVMLEVTFGPGGDVIGVEVISSDNSILTKAAVNAAWSVGGAENSTGEVRTATVPIVYVIE